METIAHWSYSALNTYLHCPMKYKFRYVEHAPEERSGGCFAFRRAFHAVLSARAIQGAKFSLDDAKENFFAFFKAETEAVGLILAYKMNESFDSCGARCCFPY